MATGADGARPRMRMYVFDGPGPDNRYNIATPAAIAGDVRNIGLASGFGAQLFDTGVVNFVWGDDGSTVPFPGAPAGTVGSIHDGCQPFTNTAALAGNIALVDRGGGCGF